MGMRKHVAWFVVLALAALNASCDGWSGSAHSGPVRPRHPRVIATIAAVLPAADSVIAFKSVLLAVYGTACSDVTDVQAVPRRFHDPRPFAARSQLIEVRCGGCSRRGRQSQVHGRRGAGSTGAQ